MFRFSAGRSFNAVATLSSAACEASVMLAVPGWNSMRLKPLPSAPPPSSENGAVTTLVNRLTMAFRINPPRLNCGSSSEPDSGRSMSITPLRSCSSATANRTGRLVASGLSDLGPSTSWLTMIWLRASSLPCSSILYVTSMLSLPRSIG